MSVGGRGEGRDFAVVSSESDSMPATYCELRGNCGLHGQMSLLALHCKMCSSQSRVGGMGGPRAVRRSFLMTR